MGQKPLTWQQVMAVLCVLAMLVASVFAWGGNIPDEYRPRGAITFWILLVVFCLLLLWHWRKVSRPDVEPDLLAQLIPPNRLLQLGPAHFHITVAQAGSRVRLVALIQNTRDGDGQIELTLKPERHRTLRLATSSGIFETSVPPLQCAMPPAGLVLAWTNLTLQPFRKPVQIRFWLSGSSSASGDDVRFARRSAVSHRTSGWVTLLALLGGHIHTGGGTFLEIKISPFAADAAVDDETLQPSNNWATQTLWMKKNPTAVTEIRDLVSELLSPDLATLEKNR